MKSFKFRIPVEGIITTEVIADSAQEALDIILSKRQQLEYHPHGHLEMLMDSVIIIETKKTVS